MSCGVGHRYGSDPTLLWLWRRPVAIAPSRSLAWEPPFATGPKKIKAKKENVLTAKRLTLKETLRKL